MSNLLGFVSFFDMLKKNVMYLSLRAVFTWLSKRIGFGFGFGFTTPFSWLVYLLWFWFYDSQVKTALSQALEPSFSYSQCPFHHHLHHLFFVVIYPLLASESPWVVCFSPSFSVYLALLANFVNKEMNENNSTRHHWGFDWFISCEGLCKNSNHDWYFFYYYFLFMYLFIHSFIYLLFFPFIAKSSSSWLHNKRRRVGWGCLVLLCNHARANK